jgi:uncharacterized protein (TIGR03437 family)
MRISSLFTLTMLLVPGTYLHADSTLVRAIAVDRQGNIFVAGESNSADFPITPGAFQPRLPSALKALSNAGQTVGQVQVGTSTVGVVAGTKDGRVLYAAANGMSVSGDSGATWRSVAPLPIPGALFSAQPGVVNAIAVDSLDPATLLVATSAGLFGSTDGGRSWYPRNTGLPVSASGSVSVSTVFYDPADPLIAYAASRNPSYLFRSTDAGNSWQPLYPTFPGEPPPPTVPFPSIAAALSPDGKTLYVVNGNGTLLNSSDGGASWTRLAQGVFCNAVKIQVDGGNPDTLYVLDLVDLRKSTDGGASFSVVTAPVGPRQFALDSSGALYVSDYERIAVSPAGGATFTVLPIVSYSVNALTSVAGAVYLGTAIPTVPFVTKFDPTGSNILYSTFFGGTSGDIVNSLAVDEQGDAVLAGAATSPDFPVTTVGVSPPPPGKSAAFVAKLNHDGSSLVYSTLLGGSNSSAIQAVALDSFGAAYIAGATRSTDFPTTARAFQPAIPPGACPRPPASLSIGPDTGNYGFVAKLSPDGTSLLYATYLTGTCGSSVQSVSLDGAGNAIVAGYTTSQDYPVTSGSYQTTFPGDPTQPSPPNAFDTGFVSKLSPLGDKLIASTLLGSGYSTHANAVVLDAAGDPYVTGSTQGFTGGGTPGVHQPALVDRCTPPFSIGPSLPYTGTGDAFVLHLDPGLSSARFLTYLGGGCQDSAAAIALDAAGNIWLTGATASPDFPLKGPFRGGGISSGFLTELSPDASSLLFSSFSQSQVLATNATVAYQVASDGRSIAVSKIDPSATPEVRIDSVTTVSGYSPALLDPFAPGVAPGQLVEIQGENLGPQAKVNAELDSTGRLPFVLGGTVVYFGNIPAPLLSVESTSIVCFAPFEITAAAEVAVSSNGRGSNEVLMGVPASLARILSVVNEDGTLNSAGHPARLGSAISLYVAGLGETDPLSVDGLTNTEPMNVPLAAVSVYLPGLQLAPSYVGAAPGMIAGISQVNVPLPASIPGGVTDNKIAISINATKAPLYVAQ